MSNGRLGESEKGKQGSVLAWRAAYFGETSLVVLNLRCERRVKGRLKSEPMGDDSRSL